MPDFDAHGGDPPVDGDDALPDLIPLSDSSDDEHAPTLAYHPPRITPRPSDVSSPSAPASCGYCASVALATAPTTPVHNANAVFTPCPAVEKWIHRHKVDFCAVLADVSAYSRAYFDIGSSVAARSPPTKR